MYKRAAKTGLRISSQKAKEMQAEKQGENVLLKVGQEPVDEFTSFTYPGSIVTSNGDAQTEAAELAKQWQYLED
ncbi:Hypothetical predicted protein [Octopus vulgaris]|uniref:Uncharacterized protein n=1 Tax=Octopus vulgaris TaxID=6645 RepID=A0AA36B626_OCTVU|nr:Hypothetical predicted protein [Octopus vulgaris]